MVRVVGRVLGALVAVVMTIATFWAVAIAIPEQGTSVPRILWVILRAIYALPDLLELPALGLFSLVIGLGAGWIVTTQVARLAGKR